MSAIRGLLGRLLGRSNAPAVAPPTQTATPPVSEAAVAPEPELDAATTASRANAFAFDLWKALPATTGNLVVSPPSVEVALLLAYAGARGETAAEMRRALALGDDRDATLAEWGTLARDLTKPGRARKLRIANRLFVDTRYTLLAPYVEEVGRVFGAPASTLDFLGDGEQARRRINDWVEEQTENALKNFLPTPLEPRTRLVLVDAVYFLGDWANAFDRALTRRRPFARVSGGARDVPMMHRTGRYAFARTDGVSIVELPYHGNVAMLAVLPNDPPRLGQVEASLDVGRLTAWTRALSVTEVDVVFPRFTLDAEGPLELKEALRGLGMSRPFDPGRADFRGIADGPSADDGLFVDGVVHKAFVKVDEQGTEAAASTAVAMAPRGLPVARPSFVADRPFLFLILDKATGLVLFVGAGGRPGVTRPDDWASGASVE